MRLNDYINAKATRGTCAKLAVALGVNSVMISQWRYDIKQVPAERCPEIERATDGEVRCEDLRPDVDWAYLRSTVSPTPTLEQKEAA